MGRDVRHAVIMHETSVKSSAWISHYSLDHSLEFAPSLKGQIYLLPDYRRRRRLAEFRLVAAYQAPPLMMVPREGRAMLILFVHLKVV